jgi:sugar lactone lactonase YvrE
MEIVADQKCETGECPVWLEREQALYWADIPRGLMYRFDPASRATEQVWEGQQLGGLVVQADGSLLQFLEEGHIQIWRDGKTIPVIHHLESEQGTRFNDARADPIGRILAGTMPGPDGNARLYRIDVDGTPTVLLHDVGQSNGIVFSRDGEFVFHTDTKAKTITRYRYDLATGTIDSPKVVVHVQEPEQVPDGLSIDAIEMLWSARWGGSCLVWHAGNGIERERLAVPTPQVSSCAFGGPDLRDLYITTAGGHQGDLLGPNAGCLFRTPAPVPGLPVHLSRILL